MTENPHTQSTETQASPDVAELNRQRAAEVVAAIDPDHRLPKVSVIANPDHQKVRGTYIPVDHQIVHDGNIIGTCTVVSSLRTKERWFHGVRVDEALRGNGFGMATYKTAIEQAMLDGFDFRTEDWSQTVGAKKVWETLAEKGVAQVVDGFTPDGTGHFNGHYVIPSAQHHVPA